MFKLNPKKVLLKQPTIYDFQLYLPEETRKAIVLKSMIKHPNLQIKGGNSLTNPYKIPFELVLADKREAMEKYKNSVLWSPRFTPWHFRFAFLYPMGFGVILIWYIHNVAMPRRMVELKRKYGYVFPDMEASGRLDGWWDYEDEAANDHIYDIQKMEFKKTTDKVLNHQYTDFTIKDLNNFSNKSIFEGKSDNDNIIKERSMLNPKDKQKLQSQFQKVYNIQQGVDKK